MSAKQPQADRSRYIHVFNLGFRRGANDRAAVGLAYEYQPGQPRRTAPETPPTPKECILERAAWKEGYATGYEIGASDSELASVEVPGACGMISGLGEEILELMGLFRSQEDEPDKKTNQNNNDL